ncbi:MAG: type II CAAX endopeptidase family protein, partial [Clostridia bacterium]|nr:type II CAAX endopeptidase family protein [Clostridia bacterium]
MQNKKKIFTICSLVSIFCIIMAVVDGVLMADYFAKSAIKLVLFLGFPAVYAFFDKELSIKPLFKLKGKGLLLAVFLGVGVYAVILGGYLLLKDVFDFGNITGALTKNIGVTGKNFIYVSIYISFVNSLLEEFFFRGFAFLTLKNVSSRKFSYIFSAGVFAIYHVAMMTGWFSLPVFIIVMAGLFVGGLIFNYLNEKSGTVYPSWLLHMCANFAINTVGFI